MTDVTIPDLPFGVTLTGTEPLETVQAGVSVQVPTRSMALASDPLVLSGPVGALTGSRALTAGSGISIVDNGGGSTLIINSTGIVASNAEFVLLASEPSLPESRRLIGTANQIIITDNGAGSTVVLSAPQDIGPMSSPTFGGLTVNGIATVNGTLQATTLTLTNALTVPYGGTGAATLTGLVQGHGTSAFTAITDSNIVGQTLRVTGASTYAWGALDLGNISAVTGTLPVGNGGSGATTLTGILQGNGASPFTAVTNSTTVGQVLRVTGANTYGWGALDLADSDAVTGALPIANGGTGQITKAAAFDALSPMTTLGDVIYGDASGTGTRLAGNTTTNQLFLSQTGTGAISAAPTWSALPGTFSGFANPTASVGLSAVNGAATTAMRSDAAPALSQSITPTWTGVHTFTATPTPLATLATGDALVTLDGTTRSRLSMGDTGAASNEKYWRLTSDGGNFSLETENDSRVGSAAALTITRSGVTPVATTFNTTLSATNLLSSSYTPTGTLGTNASSVTPLLAHYFRIGNLVTVAGAVTIGPTASGSICTVELTLPIASSLTLATDLAGSGSTFANNNVISVLCSAATVNDRAALDFLSNISSPTTTTARYMYTYIVQ